MKSSTFINILIGLSLSGVSAALLYLLLRKEEDDLDNIQRLQISRSKVIEIKIPKEIVGVVIGRGGSNIHEIQIKTKTKITFSQETSKEDSTDRICIIRGTEEATQLAESMIHEFIMSQPLIEVQEMIVPSRSCGRIIGKNGDNIRKISRTSNAKITVEDIGPDGDNEYNRRVIIKGTAEQIAVAKSLVQEKVDEDMELRRKLAENASNRSPRLGPRPQCITSSNIESNEVTKSFTPERLVATGNDGFLEVYVSAVEHPGKFWLQMIGPRAVELDHLVNEMTEYYSQDVNQELHVIKKVNVEQLVAAPFNMDKRWYRARVLNVVEDDYNPADSKVSLYYVDYGDSTICKQGEVCELRTDFLRLRFQAIECSLAKIKPVGATWSDEATDLFEDLCHVAQWKVLMSQVDSYSMTEDHGGREGSPIPCVELYDTAGAEDVRVAEVLVKQGQAEWLLPLKPSQTNGCNEASGSTERVWRHPVEEPTRNKMYRSYNDSDDGDEDELEMF